MSVLLRARIASFMSGVAVTSVFAIYQLKKDLDESQEIVVKQVLSRKFNKAVELNFIEYEIFLYD